jgi:hypothetical protein
MSRGRWWTVAVMAGVGILALGGLGLVLAGVPDVGAWAIGSFAGFAAGAALAYFGAKAERSIPPDPPRPGTPKDPARSGNAESPRGAAQPVDAGPPGDASIPVQSAPPRSAVLPSDAAPPGHLVVGHPPGSMSIGTVSGGNVFGPGTRIGTLNQQHYNDGQARR